MVVRGRCFGTRKGCFAANRALEDLLWQWGKSLRPYIVYEEGSEGTGGGGPVPKWLEKCICFKDGFCQCNLVRDFDSAEFRVINGRGWHHPGKLYSNINDMKFAFERHCFACPGRWGCKCDYSRVKCNYPREPGTKHTVNETICVSLVCIALHVWEHSNESTNNFLVCCVPRKYDPRRNQPPRFGVESRAGRWRKNEEAKKAAKRRKWIWGGGFMNALMMMLAGS